MSSEPIRLDDYRYETHAPDGYFSGEVDPANPVAEEDDLGLLAMNPYILWGLLVLSILVSGPIIFTYAPEGWGVARKLVATVLMGTLSHYCLFINRILVAKW